MDIVNFKKIDRGCLEAKFDVVIGEWGLTIREMTLLSKDGKQWINFPSRQYEKDGQKKNFDYVVFEKSRKERFQAAVLEKIGQGCVQKMYE